MVKQIKKIVFLTGTRADFGKLKPLINKVEGAEKFSAYVFVTGMHTLSKFGSTYIEVEKQNYKNIYVYMNQTHTIDPDVILSNTILGFGNYIKEIKPDMIVVHGDRIEAFAGAIVGSFNNILVCHVEGGEISGTLDEMIRHAITKLSHVHFVANKTAKKRLIQMGEKNDSIFVIGSPDIDVMKSNRLPSIKKAKERYDINFKEYAIFIYHPVTTELDTIKKNIKTVISALIESNEKYIVIYPNNDQGSDIIISEIKKLKDNKNFKVFPSLRFEYFLKLLKESNFIIGNSSAGIREAEIYAVPAIDIGNRQKNRTRNKNIIKVEHNKKQIIDTIKKAKKLKLEPLNNFGKGDSAEKFYEIITKDKIWKTDIQKQFKDIT